MSSVTVLAETPTEIAELKPPKVAKKATTSKVSRQATSKRNAANGAARERYFLAGSNGDNTPALGRELESESEAIIAAFREQTRFLVLTEWQVAARMSGSMPQLVKEGVK